MNKNILWILVFMISVQIVLAEDWTAEWYNCDNVKVRLNVSADTTGDLDSDGDTLINYEERLWDLKPNSTDTDGDSLQEGNEIYSFADPCPKHCNNFCTPRRISYWRSVVCDGSYPWAHSMINDYMFKINQLSYVFNSGDALKPIIYFGLYSSWKYNDSDINLSDDWINRTYDDSGWPEGDAYLGFGEFLISTNLSYGGDDQNKTITYYFRKHFNMTNVTNITNLELNIDYDDGFVAYLNGNEILRSSGASTDHYTTVPYHESSIGDASFGWLSYELNSTEIDYLIDGENVLAVEVHQTMHPAGKVNSSDIVLGAYLASYENISSRGLLENASDACDLFNSNATNEDYLKRELLALWFNVVAADICYVKDISHDGICSSIPADNVQELVSYAENALINNLTSEYQNITSYLNLISNGNCVDCAGCFAPTFSNITLNADNKSSDLMWLPAIGAAYYTVYYSDNLTVMRNLDTGNLPDYVYNASVYGTNWTDYQPVDHRTRFYRVATRCINNNINVSRIILGKQTYYLIASQSGDKQNNLFALIHDYNNDLSIFYNYSYDFSRYLNAFCDEFPITCSTRVGIPIIQTIVRDDPEKQLWNAHPYSFAVGALYPMKVGVGYKILVNKSYNKTEVGVVPDYIIVNLTASSDGDKQNNLFGDIYIENETFADRLDEICGQYPNICDTRIGIPIIQTIVRDDPEKQLWNAHPYSFAVGSLYPMYSGVGYKILVNESIFIVYNNTVIQ